MARHARALLDSPDPDVSCIHRVRHRVGDSVRDALAAAYAEEFPLWLLVHLWRNGISKVTFVFVLNDGFEADLRVFTAAMRELFLSPQPSSEALTTVGKRMYRPTQAAHMTRAQALEPMPSTYPMAFVVLDPLDPRDDAGPAFEWRFRVNCSDVPLLALQEALFLYPADAPIPYGIQICAFARDGMIVTPCLSPMPVTPCELCGCQHNNQLYWYDSPTQRATRRCVARLGVSNADITDPNVDAHDAPAQQFNICRCAKCEACGVLGRDMKRCARCHTARYCNAACQRAHWREHRASCRAASQQ